MTKRKTNTMSILSFVFLVVFVFAVDAKRRIASYARCHEGNLVWDLPPHRNVVLPEAQKRILTCMCLEKMFSNANSTCPIQSLFDTNFRHIYETEDTLRKWRHYEDRCSIVKTKTYRRPLLIIQLLLTATAYFILSRLIDKKNR